MHMLCHGQVHMCNAASYKQRQRQLIAVPLWHNSAAEHALEMLMFAHVVCRVKPVCLF